MIEQDLQTLHSMRYFRRKLLQTNSSTFATSQPAFIALLTVIIILTIALVIIIIILCFRYYSHRERRLRHRHRKHRRDLSTRDNQSSPNPISITPTPASSYSGRSTEQLLSDRPTQNLSINTLPSRRVQQSLLDAYLNDLNSGQPVTIDPKQLKSYLFIDLHSTSSETFPNTMKTSGYQTSTDDYSQPRQSRYQRRHRSTMAHQPRFLMRERTLPKTLQSRPSLPQLRQLTNQKQRRLFGDDDTTNSTTTVTNPDLLSTTMSTTTEEYDESHAYNVKQNQMLQTIREERPFTIERYLPSTSFPYEREPYLFEVVSTSRDDSCEIQIPYRSSPIPANRIVYMNDSIIV